MTDQPYKNMILANAAITNTIYLTTANKNGTMSMKRRDFTDETLRAASTHMMESAKRRGRAVFSWQLTDGGKSTLAHIPDKYLNSFLSWCDEVGYMLEIPDED